ncbi:hypothetical protein MMPV_006617 [Pyropia vietnamensis]
MATTGGGGRESFHPSSSPTSPSARREGPPSSLPVLSDAHYVDARTAAALDACLMAAPSGKANDSGVEGGGGDGGLACGFPLEALMELAGQAVAHAIAAAHPDRSSRVVVLAGPGNNGGDGLVAARHLAVLGYPSVSVIAPVRRERAPFVGLYTQLEAVGVPVLGMGADAEGAAATLPPEGEVDVLVDALFGFSFRPPVRPPYGELLVELRRRQLRGGGEADRPPPPAVVVVDVPSGWGVDTGEPPAPSPRAGPPGGDDGSGDDDTADTAVAVPPAVANNPSGRDMLVSLSAPKVGTRGWRGAHYVGGRFVPRRLADALGITLVPYDGDALVQRVRGGEEAVL